MIRSRGPGDYLAGGLVLLELKHVQNAISVSGEQVDDLSKARRDLAADNEQRLAEDRRLSLDELFEPRLVSMPPGRSRTGLSSTRHRATMSTRIVVTQTAAAEAPGTQCANSQVRYSRKIQQPYRPASTSSDQYRLVTCTNDRHRPRCASFTPRRSLVRSQYRPPGQRLCRSLSKITMGAIPVARAGTLPAMAGRRGWGEDSVYFDHSGECRDLRPIGIVRAAGVA
jgi:hypothetical protein